MPFAACFSVSCLFVYSSLASFLFTGISCGFCWTSRMTRNEKKAENKIQKKYVLRRHKWNGHKNKTNLEQLSQLKITSCVHESVRAFIRKGGQSAVCKAASYGCTREVAKHKRTVKDCLERLQLLGCTMGQMVKALFTNQGHEPYLGYFIVYSSTTIVAPVPPAEFTIVCKLLVSGLTYVLFSSISDRTS